VSETPPADAPPKAAGEPAAEASKAAGGGPPKKGISFGSLAKPPRGGPRAVIIRVGAILVGVLILATVVVGGSTVISRLGKHTKAKTGSPTASPSPGASGAESYFSYSNDQFQFSIDRPNDWTTRVLQSPDPYTAIVLGPPSPYPQNDVMVIRIVPLSGAIFGTSALGPFKDKIVQSLGPDVNMVSQNPESIAGLPGWNFTWDTPKDQPVSFYDGWYLLDGIRYIEMLLQIQPPSDTASENVLIPVFEHMAKSFISYAPIPQPTETATPATTGTATPKVTPSPSHAG